LSPTGRKRSLLNLKLHGVRDHWFDPFPYEIKTIPERGHCELIFKAKS